MKTNNKQGLFLELKSPFTTQIEITTECNNKCIHCYNSWRYKNHNNYYLEKSKVEHIVNELKLNEVLQVTITGGEPLFNQNTTETCLELIGLLTKAGINCSLNSNLTNLSYEIGYKLKDICLRQVLTTIFSFDEDTHDFISGLKGSFKKTIEGIKVAVKLGFRVSVNMVLNKFNKNDVYNTAKLIYVLGVKNFAVTKSSPAIGMSKEKYDLIRLSKDDLITALDDLIIAKNDFQLNSIDVLECHPICLFPNDNKYYIFTLHKCTAGITTCTIGSNGNIRPCSHADIEYGNIFETSLLEIWQKMKDWRVGIFIPEICKKCQYFKKCSGGCRMEALYQSENINDMDPWAIVTNSLDLERLCEKPKPYKENKIIYSDDTEMKFHSSLKIRKEKFGGVLLKNEKEIMVTEGGIKLIQHLKRKGSFSISKIKNRFDIFDQELKVFLDNLIKNEIVIISKHYLKGGD